MKENNEIKSTAHSKYRCQYHIVFAPKYRWKAILGQISRKLCEWKGVDTMGTEVRPDHIHLLVSILPKYSMSKNGLSQGKSGLMIYDRHENKKYKYGTN